MLFWESKRLQGCDFIARAGSATAVKVDSSSRVGGQSTFGALRGNLGIRRRPVLPQINHDSKRPRSWRKIAKLFPEENVHFEAAALADKLIRAMDAASMRHMDQIAKARGKSSQ
jgi:hypothetical protein